MPRSFLGSARTDTAGCGPLRRQCESQAWRLLDHRPEHQRRGQQRQYHRAAPAPLFQRLAPMSRPSTVLPCSPRATTGKSPYCGVVPKVLSVNIADHYSDGPRGRTGFDKRPTTEPVAVRAPGGRRNGLGSGLAGDLIGNRKFHGGDDQAVYAYAREDLDAWEDELDRSLANGMFG